MIILARRCNKTLGNNVLSNMDEMNFTNHIKISEEKCEAISARVFLSHLPALVVSDIHVRANRRVF